MLAIATADNGTTVTVQRWEVATHQILAVLHGPVAEVGSLTFSGRMGASGDDRAGRLWPVGDPRRPRARGVLNTGAATRS